MCSLPEKNLEIWQSSIIDTYEKQTNAKKSKKKSDVAIPQTNCSLFESSQDISIRQEKRCFSIEAPIWQKLQMASAIPISRDWIVFSKKEVTTVVLVFWQSYYIKDSLSIEKNVLAFPTILKNTRHYRDQWSHFATSEENIPLLFKKDDPVLTSAIVSTFKEKPYKAKNEWRQRGLYNVHMFSLRWAFVFGLHGRKCQPSSRVKASLDHQEKDKLNVQWGDGSAASYRPFGDGSERNIYFFPSTHHHIIGHIEMKKGEIVQL